MDHNLLDKSSPHILPRNEMLSFVKENIRYEEICHRIGQQLVSSGIESLDRIVQLVVDLQYTDGTIQIRTEHLPADKVAHQILQLRQYTVEYILAKYRDAQIQIMSDLDLTEILYCAIGSLAAYRFAASKKLKTT